ncbi:lymphotoxin beta receptor inhibitor-like [Hetaerina americana]|uniref:lymphotoxin beta receptor inhibitor-like n=1 Tax=Hetaerina americana TaxID=62018 RepID=UPI003A7F41A4
MVPPLVLLVLFVGGGKCGVGPDMKADAATAYRMHHQLNMRGPHHPRSTEAAPTHHTKAHYQLHRPEAGEGPKLTQDTDLLHDEEHIREDLENLLPGEDTKKMSPEELEFYYFKLHDFDNNTKLDGLEILQAIQHVMHSGDDQSENGKEGEMDHGSQSGQQEGGGGDEVKTNSRTDFVEEADRLDDDFSYFVELIDKVLEEDDLDHDGYLSYVEYVQGRKKDQIKREKKNQRI